MASARLRPTSNRCQPLRHSGSGPAAGAAAISVRAVVDHGSVNHGGVDRAVIARPTRKGWALSSTGSSAMRTGKRCTTLIQLPRALQPGCGGHNIGMGRRQRASDQGIVGAELPLHRTTRGAGLRQIGIRHADRRLPAANIGIACVHRRDECSAGRHGLAHPGQRLRHCCFCLGQADLGVGLIEFDQHLTLAQSPVSNAATRDTVPANRGGDIGAAADEIEHQRGRSGEGFLDQGAELCIMVVLAQALVGARRLRQRESQAPQCKARGDFAKEGSQCPCLHALMTIRPGRQFDDRLPWPGQALRVRNGH